MSKDANPALVRFAKKHPRFFLGAFCIVVLLGGYLMVRDLTRAIVDHSGAQLFKFAALFAVATFGAIKTRARYAKIVEERDRKIV